VTRAELALLLLITALGVIIRFAYVASGSTWDVDQGTEMLALWNALTTGQLPLFGPAATSLGSTFHHGALYYDLLLPAVWLTHADPRAVVLEIAALNATVIPMVWWICRSIGGVAAGLVAALLAATSADLVFFSSFIWNPTFIEPFAALAFLGAWQAIRTGNGRWWLVAAAGFAVAAQSHVAAAALVVPLGAAFLWMLGRAEAGRLRVLGWGVAAAGLVFLTYLPVVIHELTNGFPEVHGIASYLASPPGYVDVSPGARLIFAMLRIPAWPLTGWPFYELRPGLILAAVASLGMLVAMAMLAIRIWRHGRSISGGQASPATERRGFAFVAGGLLLLTLALGLGIRAVSELNLTMSEQYHTAADALVIVAAGLIIGAIWRSRPRGMKWAGQAVATLLVLALVGWNAVHWPAFAASDGGWGDAQAAANRIERTAGGDAIGLIGLPLRIDPDAYRFPLTRDGAKIGDPFTAPVVVTACYTAARYGCGGEAEASWLAGAAGGSRLRLVDRFWASPDRVLSIYRRSP
jgi:4-amino-4-deoxy-L-arabinose transferase-like glycosyltransferase